MCKVATAFASLVVSGILSLPMAHARVTSKSEPPAFPGTVQLPQTATIETFAKRNADFRVASASTGDLAGASARGVPAWTITIRNGVGGWDGPAKLAPPEALLDSSRKLRDEIALFQVESGLGGGWIAVPRGWHVVSAVAGAQGSWGATFVAPGGPYDGWVTLGGSGPGTSEVFSAAEGYFPGAYHLENEVIPGTLTHDAVLAPAPSSLAHPDPCTVLISYKSGKLTVNGIKRVGVDGVTGFFIALPTREAHLQTLLFDAFRADHHVSHCPKDVRDW